MQHHLQNWIRFLRTIMPIMIASQIVIFLQGVGSAETVIEGLGRRNLPHATSDWLPINHLAVKNHNISRNLQVANANGFTGADRNLFGFAIFLQCLFFRPDCKLRKFVFNIFPLLLSTRRLCSLSRVGCYIIVCIIDRAVRGVRYGRV